MSNIILLPLFLQCFVFLFYSRYYFLCFTQSYSFSLNFRSFLPSSFTIILSFFFIDPCVGLGTVSFFLFYSSLLYLLETDPLFPFSILNSFYFFTHVSLLFPFLVYLLLFRSFGFIRLYFLIHSIFPLLLRTLSSFAAFQPTSGYLICSAVFYTLAPYLSCSSFDYLASPT